MKIKVNLKPIDQIIKDKGLSEDGDVQGELTKIVSNRIGRYMPYRTGVLSGKLKHIKSPTEIKVEGPYAHYQYMGEVWGPNIPVIENGIITGFWSPPNKHRTGRSLEYSKGKNSQAGPFWDRHLMAAEGDAIRADLQAYIDRKSGK